MKTRHHPPASTPRVTCPLLGAGAVQPGRGVRALRPLVHEPARRRAGAHAARLHADEARIQLVIEPPRDPNRP